jgi:hypothetical protein
MATAAFLGDSGFFCQKETDCCGKVTIFGLATVFCTAIRADDGQVDCVADSPVNNSAPPF